MNDKNDISDFKPSEQQQEIIDASKTGESFVVNALAGTGKTTTLKQICKASPERSYLYVGFNTKVVEDFRKAMKKDGITNVVAKTGDAIARSYVHNTMYAPYGLDIGYRIGGGLTASKEIFNHFDFKPLVLKERPDPEGKEEQKTVTLTEVQTIQYLKKGIIKFCISTDTEILDRHFDEYEATEIAIIYAKLLWEDYQDAEDGVLKLTFSAIFKMFALKKPSMKMLYEPSSYVVFDTLLIDEAQDTNPVAGEQYRAQTDMQVIYVGDPYQAIYGFRGAEDEMQKRSDLKSYSLTQSWRFGNEIAELGNKVLRDKLESEYLLEGKSSDAGFVYSKEMEDPNAVICRTNSGCLISLFSLLSEEKKVRLDAKTKEDIQNTVKTLGYLAGQLERPGKIDEELEDFKEISEVKTAINEKKLPKRFEILLKKVVHSPDGAQEILDSIKDLNERSKNGIQLITVHRAKGGEWDRVQLGNDFFGPRWDSRNDSLILPHPTELRLIYVAVTRAMKELAYTDSIRYIFESESDTWDRLKTKYESNSEM
jgi:superfamily I DNA/RNA helicase